MWLCPFPCSLRVIRAQERLARKGGSVQETITPGSGVDPNSPQFAAAGNACKHLLPGGGTGGVPPQRRQGAAPRGPVPWRPTA